MVEYTIFLHTGYPYFGWLGISSQVFSLAFPLFRNKVSDSLEKKSFQEYPHKCWCSSRLHSFLSLSCALTFLLMMISVIFSAPSRHTTSFQRL